MADISKITLPSGNTYDIKDATARSELASIESSVTGAMSYVGVTTTALTDGATTSPITINSADYTPLSGNVVIYGDKEFVFSDYDSAWHEFGSTGSLKALAFKDSATGSVTPTGTVSAPTFTGTEQTVTIPSVAVSGGASADKTYLTATASGTAVSSTTATASRVTSTAGTAASWSATVSNETLTFSWTANTPTSVSATDVSVVSGVSVSAQPTVTLTKADTTSTGAVELVEDVTSTSGTTAEQSITITPSGTVSQPTFTGSSSMVTVE